VSPVSAGVPPHLAITSVARNAALDREPPRIEPRSREGWATGDLVVAEVLGSGAVPYEIELPAGRLAEVLPGDLLVGALGRRTATLTAVGDWRETGDDGLMQVLGPGGVLGVCTSSSLPPPPMADVRYVGHAFRGDRALALGDFAPRGERPLEAPVVLIIGTSMEAGKTVAAKAVVRRLKALGLRVAGAKMTGVGRYRDVLAMRDAGADFVADFVDAGLPSSAVPAAEFEPALARLCGLLAAAEPDVAVIEAGASPLEPYNGDLAVAAIADNVACTVLCASDPYAVTGVIGAFEARPDLISGRATSTDAAIALIDRLVGIEALNLLDPASAPALERLLRDRLRITDL
jgi:hypothetical protein